MLTVADVAAELQMSVRHVYRLVERGELPSVRVGRKRRIEPDDFAAWRKRLQP